MLFVPCSPLNIFASAMTLHDKRKFLYSASSIQLRFYRILDANIFLLQGSNPATVAATPAKKEPPAPGMTPLEKRLQDMGPIRDNGSDKFFGMENVSVSFHCDL